MLWNFEHKRIKKILDCCECRYFDQQLKRCNGLGKVCFEYDEKTGTAIEPKTGLPIKINKEGE